MKRGPSFRGNERTAGGSSPGRRTRRGRARPSWIALGSATAAAQLERLEPRRLLAGGTYHWPLGGETLVNSHTTLGQTAPSMAIGADGDFVIAWNSVGQDGDSFGVYAQRYAAGGVRQGAEFRVNTYTAGAQMNPSAAMDDDGDFVIAWTAENQDGDLGSVYAQRFSAAGVAQGAEFLVNTTKANTQRCPSVAMAGDGDFVIAWEGGYFGYYGDSARIYAQRYSASGARQGTELLVSSGPNELQFDASAAMDDDGDFVIAWNTTAPSIEFDIAAQRYNAAGVKQGGELLVNTTAGHHARPSAAMDADGDFVVAWNGTSLDGASYGVAARRYNAAGAALGTQFRVNSFTPGDQWLPSASMNAGGELIIAWSSNGQDGVYAQRYDAGGSTLGGEMRLNTHAGSHSLTAAAMDNDGDFVVAWESIGQGGADVDYGISVQRYTTFGPDSAAAVGDRVWNDANANGIQDAGEAGIAGAAAELYTADGAPVAVTTSNGAGQYGFPVLAGASAYVRVIAPAGFLTTHANRGTNDERDSDIDRVTGRTPAFTAGAAATVNDSLDAGFSLPGSVSGVAYFDRSGDGVRNGGEEALAGFEVFLELNGNLVSPAVTDSTGSYSFGGLLGDSYRLGAVDREQWIEPALAPVVVMPGADSPIDLALRTAAHDSTHAPQGGELRVNTYTTGIQTVPSVAMDANGDFLVVWSGSGQGDSGGVFAQRHNAAGVKQGAEFRVNTYTTNAQYGPSAAMDDDGDFVITWQSHGQDGNGWGIYAQRYDAAGVKQGTEFRVNTDTISHQEDAAAAMDADGDFVIAWHSYGVRGPVIQAQRYSAAGVPRGDEFLVSHSTTLIHVRPAVAMDADGDFIVAWAGAYANQYGVFPYETFAQRYNAAGAAEGFVLSGPLGDAPSVAMDDEGNFALAWSTFQESRSDVHLRRYSAAGIAQGAGFLVNTSNAFYPSLAMDADGDLLVTWTGSDGSSEGVDARRYNAAGLAQGSAFRVNTYTTGAQLNSAAAVDAAGNFVITWWGARSQDPDYDVTAQRYFASQRPAITASPFVWNSAPQRIELTFDQDVSASLSTADLVLRNLTTGATIPAGSIVMGWNAATRTATYRFPTLPNGGSLPDGRYRATLAAAGVTNAAGTTIAVDHALDFFVLAGDANRDERVNLADFNILAANVGQSDRTFAQGDFNYDGLVNLADFNLLASRFGQALAPDGQVTRSGERPPALGGESASARQRFDDDDDDDASDGGGSARA